jgi:uncharacterized membrane protein YcaP (DUF421 family)
MQELFFKDWSGVLYVGLCAVLSYFALFLFIRISGKRTLAKLTAFDFVVTVTLGSILSSMILRKVPLAEGAVALALIILLQYLLAFGAKNSKKLEKVINSEPTLLYYNGSFLNQAMAKEVVTEDSIYAAVREFRIYRMEDVEAVVMEINGKLTVVRKQYLPSNHHSLSDVDFSRSK